MRKQYEFLKMKGEKNLYIDRLPFPEPGPRVEESTEDAPMRIVRAKDRHFQDFEWLRTYWLFSFSDYHDPNNVQLGALRVFNDDVIQPHTGFGMHPHAEMEIVTIVLAGEISHEDSLGNKTVIRAGDVQRMSAGTGIRHSEWNHGDEPVHLYQIWIHPNERGLAPSYDQKHLATRSKNALVPVASWQQSPETVTLHADATVYLGEFDAGKSATFAREKSRNVFLYVTEGELDVNGETVATHDQVRVESKASLAITARSKARYIMIDIAATA